MVGQTRAMLVLFGSLRVHMLSHGLLKSQHRPLKKHRPCQELHRCGSAPVKCYIFQPQAAPKHFEIVQGLLMLTTACAQGVHLKTVFYFIFYISFKVALKMKSLSSHANMKFLFGYFFFFFLRAAQARVQITRCQCFTGLYQQAI